MYEFWYDYVKSKYEKEKFCYMNIDVVADDIYRDIAEDAKTLILQIMNQKDHCLKEKIKK